ncbi:MAG TPA: class I SAM-dependent methyltransferase [Vicinamibacterales bacterium]|jgi:2-polyprenyl-3-methyl-5-hydroxy-6-metoxy-1,4-benzoquinol methylase|nr:class I SAM-dependent methyltransferase [Vicinamibacterales bacterium]
MQTTIPADRRQRIQDLGYDYAAQPQELLNSCNLCGANVLVTITQRDRYGYPAQASACSRCSLVFLNPRMTAAAYSRFYDGVYRPLVSAFHGRIIDARTIQAEQREYAQDRAEFVRPFLTRSGLTTMLDIGGSTGVVAGHFAKVFGLTGTLIDPAPLEVQEARAFGLETITGLVEEYDFGGRRFDFVLICQTVDHLLDVAGTLKRVRELLTPNGSLFIDIVDFRAAYLRNWSVEDAIKIDHPYYLTQDTMTAYLRRAGFETVRAAYAADHLHVSYLCRPTQTTPQAVPDVAAVAQLFREIRYVQNAPRPS